MYAYQIYSFLALLVYSRQASAGGDYAASCGQAQLRIVGPFDILMEDLCSPGNHPSALHLNSCYTNRNGQLHIDVSGGADFLASCDSCILGGTVLTCSCKNNAGTKGPASVNLSRCHVQACIFTVLSLSLLI